MKTRGAFINTIIVTIIVTIFLSGCDFSNVKIGEVRLMYGDSDDSHMSYNFKAFTGSESERVEVQAGQAILFEYEVVVDKGSVVIEWQNLSGEVVWRKALTEDESGSEEFAAEVSGSHALIVQGKGAAGSFDVSWEIK